jgi:pSer/pThr/pTyr-binding forkhead associated (FHA) protein
VILKAVEGKLEGQEFVIPNGGRCVVGRARDCSVRLPKENWMASRHHCAVAVDAPLVLVRDLGSLNGTFVNGESIGQRSRWQTAEEALHEEHVARALGEGDEIGIGANSFRVEFLTRALDDGEGAQDPQEVPDPACEVCI